MTAAASRPIRCLALAALAALLPAAAGAVVPEERVELKSLDGTTLQARLFKPEGKGPFAAVVMLHGCGGLVSSKGAISPRKRMWAEIFAGMGFVALLPDSFRSRGHGSLCQVKIRPVEPDRERPYDAYGALRWLQAQPYVKADKVALAGWSNGAMALLWTLKDDAKARPADLAHDFVAGVGIYPACGDVRKTNYKPKVPVLLQVGVADDFTPPKPCLGLVEDVNQRPGARMEIDAYEGAVHGFDHPNAPVRKVVVRHSSLRTGEKEVLIGSHPESRDKAIRRVSAYLKRALED